jgi:hypothetical protein
MSIGPLARKFLRQGIFASRSRIFLPGAVTSPHFMD